MRVLAIDASRRRGVISRSVETAARAAVKAGAEVEVIRLYDLDVRSCTGCMMCQVDASCKIEDDLPDLVGRIAEADGVIFGTPSYFRRADDATAAILDRLASYFADNGQLRLPGMSGTQTVRAGSIKRAVVITACIMPEPFATFFGYTTGPVRELRSALGAGGIRTIGSLAVTDTWRHPCVEVWERDKAESLGRVLAGKL
ncbi:MAG: flavodoxin family protein [Coriobacteriia bacterium]|nr:flavodoxin family protein [Coriobacteriia bacterium]